MKYFFKILLLILTLAVIVVFVAVLYSILIVEKKTLQEDMIIPAFFAVTGVFSFFFQVKTLKYYKANSGLEKIDIKLNAFWIVNAVFGASLIFMAGFFVYLYYYRFAGIGAAQITGIAFIVAIPFLLGIWLLLDEVLLYKNLKKSKSEILFDSIDDIKGNKEDNL